MLRSGFAAVVVLTLTLGASAWVGADMGPEEALRAVLSPAAERRAEAVLALGRSDLPPALAAPALPALIQRLRDRHSGVRRLAALSLGELGDSRAADALWARLVAETDAEALAALLLTLGRLGDGRHVARVAMWARSSPRRVVRAAALTALGDLGGPAARRVVLELLRAPGLADPDWSLRAAATLALVRCGEPEDVGAVLAAYRHGGGEEHWFARTALARLLAAKARDPLPWLRRLVLDPDDRVAVTAAVGIARRGSPQELNRLLAHRVPMVRAVAVSAVGQAHVESAYPRVRLMARSDRDGKVRWAAAMALYRLEDPAGDELVLLGLGAREPAIWAEALAALAERTGEMHGRDAKTWREALRRWRRAR